MKYHNGLITPKDVLFFARTYPMRTFLYILIGFTAGEIAAHFFK